MSSKRSRPADDRDAKAPSAKKTKIPFGRLDRRGQVIDLSIPVPKLEGSMEEPITDHDELMKLLTASTRQILTLLENAMKNLKGHAASAKKTVSNATKHLRVPDDDGFACKM
ncbi:hypothetical protein GSI_01680 [Ganoderma sinense ZZ0214-1]|uniref:Uncharacterized protein n=1 Tax=Ganoderma sinense ZZ0214-1 TaxID=1077348 RepID=A0A2G8SQI6_9APHY|nr:hypothetical protein GSI_01680 [Ganoderma sinense ZZ0214-1]